MELQQTPFSSLLLLCDSLHLSLCLQCGGEVGAGPGSPLVLNPCPPGSRRTIPRACVHAFVFGRDGIPGPFNGFYSTSWHLDA